MNTTLRLFLTILIFTISESLIHAQYSDSGIRIIGQMKDVMRKGEIDAKIDLDTISNKIHLYGLGPVEFLRGELMILDGICYKSKVVSETEMLVEQGFQTKAPFLGYTQINKWSEHLLPDTVVSIPQLEGFLNTYTKERLRPFMFKLQGQIYESVIHIQNLPPGTKVSSPSDARIGQVKYKLNNEDCEILGFFSTEHQGIFTHHGNFVHMHLLTSDKQKMGHIDELRFNPAKVRLLLPE